MRAIYNTITGEVFPDSRADDQPIEGLDPTLLVMAIVQEPAPAYDEATQVLEPTEVADVGTLTITRGWNIMPRVLTAEEQLAERRAQMAAAFDSLPVPVQAAFYMTRISAEAAMDRNRFDIARALVEAQVVPPELESVKAGILAYFPS